MPKIIVLCSTCGCSLSRWPFEVRGNTTGTYFCSSECDGTYKRVGGISPKGYEITQVSGDRKLDHRRIVEQALGRKLTRYEIVHHVNGDKLDNRLENLAVMTQREHMREHKPLSFDIEVAAALLRTGAATKDVSQRLGVTAHAVEAALARRGIRVNELRGFARGARVAWDIEKLTKLAKEGRPGHEIAQAFGASLPSLKRFLKKHGHTVTSLRAA